MVGPFDRQHHRSRRLVSQLQIFHSRLENSGLSISPFHLIKIDAYWPRSAAFHFLGLEEMEAVRERSKTLEDGTIYGTGRSDTSVNVLKNYLYAVDFPYFFLASIKAGHFLFKKAGERRNFNQNQSATWSGQRNDRSRGHSAHP